MTHKEFLELKHLEDITIKAGDKFTAEQKERYFSRIVELRDKKKQSQKQSQSIVDTYHKRQQDYQQFMCTMNYLLKGGAR